MKEYIDKIIAIEWEMFDKVQNISGRASCQDDFFTFNIMRRSQFEAWDENLCAGYLDDLEQALREGRNLLTEKYARMMEYTSSAEFELIKERLPALSEEKRALIRRITERNLKCHDALKERFPLVAGNGRPQYAGEERNGCASIETYMLGELSTYSLRTLKLYEDYMNAIDVFGKNIPALILEKTAGFYGYDSLEQAEQALRKKSVGKLSFL